MRTNHVVSFLRRLEEVLGFVGMTPVGRLRRHRAAVALGRVAASSSCPALNHPPRLARVLALACTAASEQSQFQVCVVQPVLVYCLCLRGLADGVRVHRCMAWGF